jgi:hypothetical protein
MTVRWKKDGIRDLFIGMKGGFASGLEVEDVRAEKKEPRMADRIGLS